MPNLFVLIVAGIIALFVIFVLIYKSFYKKAPADAALVISGGQQKTRCVRWHACKPDYQYHAAHFFKHTPAPC